MNSVSRQSVLSRLGPGGLLYAANKILAVCVIVMCTTLPVIMRISFLQCFCVFDVIAHSVIWLFSGRCAW